MIRYHEHVLRTVNTELARKADQMKQILSEDDLLNFKINLANEVQRRIDDNSSQLLNHIQEQTDAKAGENAKLTQKIDSLKERAKSCMANREIVTSLSFLECKFQACIFRRKVYAASAQSCLSS